MKPRIAILISGGGSNMVSLVNSMKSNRINALPAIVISNNPNAAGLKKASELDVPTISIDHKIFNGKFIIDGQEKPSSLFNLSKVHCFLSLALS